MSSYNILVLGTGYVGLITALGLADIGHKVTAADISEEKIKKLNKGVPIIYEDGLQELLNKHLKQTKNISFKKMTDDIVADYDVIFICVGTPQSYDGSSNLTYLDEAAKMIGRGLKSDKYTVIVNKSTVPPKTHLRVQKNILSQNPKALFDVVSNPEFLKEGTAIHDFMNPDRIVIGCNTLKSSQIMNDIYQPMVDKGFTLYETDIISAELIKYAANVFLSTKITFINELSHICEAIGADIDFVAQGIGLDPRIGDKFLKAGPGYGGSCFPKDTQALSYFAKQQGVTTNLVDSVISVNSSHVLSLIPKTRDFFEGHWKGKTVKKHIAVLGLAFKAGTDDIRDSVSLRIIPALLDDGFEITVYDPAAMENAKKVMTDVHFAESLQEALSGKDGVLILTEWPEFCQIDWEKTGQDLTHKIIVDLRNIIDRKEIEKLCFAYYSIGKSPIHTYENER